MCKRYEIQQSVIDDAKLDTPEVYALYEQGVDLVGICKVFNRCLAILMHVNEQGELDYYRHATVGEHANEGEVKYLIRKLFGVTGQYERGMYTLCTC